MAFNLTEFVSQVNRKGLAVNNLFTVTITPPVEFGDAMSSRDLTFFCKSVKLPDNSINAIETKPVSYGALEAYPVGMGHDLLTCEFYVDQNMDVMKFFHRWQQYIYNYDSSGGMESTSSGMFPYELNYKERYIGKIDVDVYSGHDPNVMYRIHFNEVFPLNIAMPSISWVDTADIMVLPIGFRYTKMKNQGNITGTVVGGGAYSGGINVASDIFGNMFRGTNVPTFLSDIQNVRRATNELGTSLRRLLS